MGGVLPYVAALGVHLTWGAQPVFTRYLQTAGGLSSLGVLLANQFLALVLLVAAEGARWCCRRHAPRAAAAATAAPGGNFRPRPWPRRRLALVAALYGLVTAARAFTNVLSTRLAAAWHVSTVAMLGPFVTGALSRVALGERVSPWIWPCVAAASGGAWLVASGERASRRFDRADALGCGVQVCSMVFSACARVLMKLTAGRFSPPQLMFLQYGAICALAPLALIASGDLDAQWTSARRLDAAGLLVLGALAALVSFLAAQAQIVAIRWLGPANYTTLQPSRVLATLAVGALLLGERVAGAKQKAGLAVVAAAVLVYLVLRRAASPRVQPPVAGADDVELPRTYAPVAHSDAVGVFVIGGDDSDDDAT